MLSGAISFESASAKSDKSYVKVAYHSVNKGFLNENVLAVLVHAD